MKTLDSLYMVGVDWKMVDTAKLAVLEGRVDDVYELLYPHVDELVVLPTCNRFEVYMVRGNGCSMCIEEVLRFIRLHVGVEKPRVLRGVEAARHLFRVASGLESMVLGEPEILGQVKRAFEYALKRAYTGKLLDLVFRYAIKTGKRVRSETGIGKGSIGIPGAAVILAEEKLGTLKDKIVGVIGAGEAGSIIASLAAKKGAAKILIANRSFERARSLAKSLGEIAEPVEWGLLERLMTESDVVFAAITVDRPVIPASVSRSARRGLVVIDISNVPVFESLPEWVEYHGFNEVVEVARRMAEVRRSEVPKAEKIIEEELNKLMRAVKKRIADEAIETMMKFAKAMVDNEVRRAVSVLRGRGIDVGAVEDVLRDLAWSSVRKSLRPLIIALQEAAEAGRIRMLEEVRTVFEKEYAKVVAKID
ncbi:glutamyl-tRNA reductase [Pyrolobus fumarii 1A]|uniref:Glutamyl-tRNA reductase n=1 Tax=Pyrolobus fumarii (strain DSM 11204 / 1A) TaxID=694429 RepID=G0EGR3_PYRF1|nr:glutamyl-tRNA reductase [Pyrolobus fumarii]AEM39211.1 glutamyl-tRNA reductase [Pyrolobus fumarii 1A]